VLRRFSMTCLRAKLTGNWLTSEGTANGWLSNGQIAFPIVEIRV